MQSRFILVAIIACVAMINGGARADCYTVGDPVSWPGGINCATYYFAINPPTIFCDECEPGATAQRGTLLMCSGETVTKYMCARKSCTKGYYADATGTCAACPNGGTTAGDGTNAITDCYLPTGSPFTDDAGSGTYKEDCYYTK